MKRFYQSVTVSEAPQGFHLQLDGKPVRIPDGAIIVFPNQATAETARAEWDGQGGKIDWQTMPCTRLIGGAMTLDAAQCERIRKTLADYGDTDLLYYRSDEDALQALQREQWDPVLTWAEAHWGIRFECAVGIMPVAQPEQTMTVFHKQIAQLNSYQLALFSQLVPVLGSLILALALKTGHLSVEEVTHLSQLDEDWQAKRWGEDAEAQAARVSKSSEIQLLGSLIPSLM